MEDALSRKLERRKRTERVALSALFVAVCWRACCSCHRCVWMVLRPPADRAFIVEWFRRSWVIWYTKECLQ